MPAQTALERQEIYLRDRLYEKLRYVKRVVILSSMVVVFYSKLPVAHRQGLVQYMEEFFCRFFNAECLYKDEDTNLKSWNFILTGNPMPSMYKKVES